MSSAAYPPHREYVGRPDAFDTLGASHFTLLTMLGLREHHHLLDIGCGSLRSGRLLIPYLAAGHYFAVEPNTWLVDAGIQNELGADIMALKAPSFASNADFVLTGFGQHFDYVHAHSVLTHAALWMYEKLCSQLKAVLTPSGVFVGTYRRGEVDYQGNEWVYPGQVTYAPKTLAGVAQSQGLTMHELTWPHPAQSYLILLHQEHSLQDFLASVNQEHTLSIADRLRRL